MKCRRRITAFVAALVIAAPAAICAQGVSVDVSAGRLVYDPLVADIGTNNLMGSLRYDTARGVWTYGAASMPLTDAATFWGGAGAGGRFARRAGSRASLGAEVAGHGYSFRDTFVDQVGSGGLAEIIPFVRLSAGLGYVEGRGSWRGHTLTLSGITERRGVFETGARAGYGAVVRVEGEARWVHAAEGVFPFAGVTLTYNGAPVQVWGQAGKWLQNDLDEATWGGGLIVALNGRSSVWANVRQEAPDPLYWNTARRTWSVGMTQRLGRMASPIRPFRAEPAGGVLVTLRASDAPPGQISIAGDFNDWQPTPMQRDGESWVVRLPVGSGVYHYAFRSATGTWFVPSSTPGRRDDGMGGHLAVLIVS
ncbi:MAG TPA: glycogen-binding domain-containing protein [Vicinamibacterales bacterium]|nr:glycogen-binding domain-containing protein [Vicinamibacterales bacterium]